jgi:hypothetical protein
MVRIDLPYLNLLFQCVHADEGSTSCLEHVHVYGGAGFLFARNL